MKIAICVNSFAPSIGGCEYVTRKLAEDWCLDHEVFVFTRKVKNRQIKEFSKYKIIEYLPGNASSFLSTIKHIDADVIFIYSDVFDYFRNIVFQKNKAKVILCPCGANWIFNNRGMINTIYRYVQNIDLIICHSARERDYKLFSIDTLKEKMCIIPNGVDIEEFDNVKTTREILDKDIKDYIWILNVSNFFPGKGQEHLINILSSIEMKNKIAYIQISHDIDFAIGKELESRWKFNLKKLQDKEIIVRLYKNLSRDKVIGFFKNSNVFAFTSEKEVAPIVLLESMASRLPWVSTDVGNAADLSGGQCIQSVKNGKFNSVFDDRVYKLFKEGIESLSMMPAIADAGRKQIETHLNWKQILPKYRNLLLL